MKTKKRWKTVLKGSAVFVLLLVLLSCGFLYSKGWLHRTFRAGEAAAAILEETHSAYTIRTLEDGALVFMPEEPEAGLIFYPGGLVEMQAYAPLMDRLASEKIACILLKTRSGLPMFEKGIADGKILQFQEVPEWYIGGHSMGGLAAASYAARHAQDFEGLILLAAYSGQDLTGSGLKVLCSYGTMDRVLNKTMYEENKAYLPGDYRETVIEGGCHSYYADYGVKGGDGTPQITMQEQIDQTAKAVLDFMRG